MSALNLARDLTYNLETKLKVTFDFKHFRSFKYLKNSAWFERYTNVIQLPNVRSVRFREFLYHELAHTLCNGYAIPNTYFKIFTSKSPNSFKYVFDNWFSEQSLYTDGLVQQALDYLEQRGELERRDGAL